MKRHASQQQVIDDIVYGLQSGDLQVHNINISQSSSGWREIALILVDVRPSFGLGSQFGHQALQAAKVSKNLQALATAIPTFSSLSIYPPASQKEPLTDLGTREEPIVGYRDFILNKLISGEYVLQSRNEVVWPHRAPLRALCMKGKGRFFSQHDAPLDTCGCGIYTYSDPDDANLKQEDVVWGEVAMWGEVLICENGYRSEFAYPKNLFMKNTGTKLIRHIKEELERAYGVPVFLVKEREGKTASEIITEILDRELSR